MGKVKTVNESFNSITFYKYRSLDNFKNFVDIIVNNRLYAAKYQELNDPMEGHFYYNSNIYGREVINEIRLGKSGLCICSLSESPNIGLLWSHYADSCKGVVIELEVEGNIPKKVKYVNELIDINDRTMASDILMTKLKSWNYEKEYRVLTHKQYVSIKIRSIILGSKMEESMSKLVKKLVSRINNEIIVKTANIEEIDY